MSNEVPSGRTHWKREEIAAVLSKLTEGRPVVSQRQLAEATGIPRGTLQHWLERRETLEADPAVVAFFESSVGTAFLHRLVLAAHLVMTLVGPCGIRLVCLFLELTELDVFVAASYGPQQKVAVAIEQAVGEFAQTEQKRLAQGMPRKTITVCQDETFHPEPCLVALEPVSNYILLEQYAEDRQAETWTQAMAAATQDLRVEIIQSTSDEGRSLCRHVKHDLEGHHSPDLFHVQQDLVRGCSVGLASRQRQAAQALAQVVESETAQAEKPALNPEENGVGRQELPASTPQEQAARQALQTATEQQDRAHRAVAQISTVYHPYDLQTGQPQSADQVSAALEQQFADLEAVAAEAHLPDRCVKKIQKAKRVVMEMVATIAFFWLIVRAKVEALALTPEVEHAVYNRLLPGIYLDLVSQKTTDVQQRARLQQKSQDLLAPLRQATGPFASLENADRRVIEAVALECAQVFQRSSSCVEGRNGQLALHHHSLHRLRERKLTALTAVHNYFIRRSDGTTAAERFFGAKPKDLFEWVLERVELPGWSAQKRAQPQRKEYLAPAMA